MRSLVEKSRGKPSTDSIVRGDRLLNVLLVALALCVAAFGLFWLAFLPSSTPEAALDRTVSYMRWVWPILMIFALPVLLLYLEARSAKRRR